MSEQLQPDPQGTTGNNQGTTGQVDPQGTTTTDPASTTQPDPSTGLQEKVQAKHQEVMAWLRDNQPAAYDFYSQPRAEREGQAPPEPEPVPPAGTTQPEPEFSLEPEEYVTGGQITTAMKSVASQAAQEAAKAVQAEFAKAQQQQQEQRAMMQIQQEAYQAKQKIDEFAATAGLSPEDQEAVARKLWEEEGIHPQGMRPHYYAKHVINALMRLVSEKTGQSNQPAQPSLTGATPEEQARFAAMTAQPQTIPGQLGDMSAADWNKKQADEIAPDTPPPG